MPPLLQTRIPARFSGFLPPWTEPHLPESTCHSRHFPAPGLAEAFPYKKSAFQFPIPRRVSHPEESAEWYTPWLPGCPLLMYTKMWSSGHIHLRQGCTRHSMPAEMANRKILLFLPRHTQTWASSLCLWKFPWSAPAQWGSAPAEGLNSSGKPLLQAPDPAGKFQEGRSLFCMFPGPGYLK